LLYVRLFLKVSVTASLLRILRSLALLGAAALAAFSVVVAMLGALGILGVLPARSLMAGMSFVPPLVTAALGLAAASTLAAFGLRRAAVVVALVQLTFFAAFGDHSLRGLLAEPPPAGGRRLTAVALNVQYFTEGASRVAAFLKGIDAGVVLLSEAEGSVAARAAFATAMQPYEVRYAAKGDTAIASRHKLLSFTEVPLPTYQPSLSGFNETATQYRNPRRTFVHAVVDVEGVAVNVLSVRFIAGRGRSHAPLDQLHWGRFLLREQSREAATFVRYVAQLKGPVLFGGDLNATSSSTSIQRLKALARDAYMEQHAWGAFTFKTKLLPIQKEKNLPALRLDYMFVRNGLMPARVEVLPGEVSDHFPVYGEFLVLDSDS
jgi:endonuclease/exonuclease/phosphatase (EEP) superfamily protein YafD